MRKEVQIGLMGAIALAVLFFGINFLKGIDVFSSTNAYYITFTDAKGLTRNSTVFANGISVGRVSQISYDANHPGSVVVEVATDKSLRIPRGSVVRIDEALLGGCTLSMKLGSMEEDAFAPGDTICGSEVKTIMQSAADVMPQVASIAEKVDTLVAALNLLVTNPNLPVVLEHAAEISENLSIASAQLGALLGKDVPQMTATFTQTAENYSRLGEKLNALDLQATLDSVSITISSIHQMMDNIQNPNGSLGKLMHDPSFYDNLNHTAQSADSLLVDLKAHPKRYVHFSVFGRKE